MTTQQHSANNTRAFLSVEISLHTFAIAHILYTSYTRIVRMAVMIAYLNVVLIYTAGKDDSTLSILFDMYLKKTYFTQHHYSEL